MSGRPMPGGYCNASNKTAITVVLVSEDPHPDPRPEARFYKDLVKPWWGREIQVGRPRRPRLPNSHRCNPLWVYDLLGPPELVELLIKNGIKGVVVCEHQVARVLGT